MKIAFILFSICISINSFASNMGDNVDKKLIECIHNNNISCVSKVLNNKDLQINRMHRGYTALIIASREGRTEIVKILLTHPKIRISIKDDDNYSNGDTALMHAASNGNTEVVKALLSHSKIDLSLVNMLGLSALMIAASEGHAEVVKALLSHPKIDITIKDYDGNTVMDLATNPLIKEIFESHNMTIEEDLGDIFDF